MTNLRVVLIEDHALTRVGLRAALQQHEVEVVGEAADGVTGLALLERTHPDVALVDIGLPSMDGVEVTRQFKQATQSDDPELPPTKILILTMQDNQEAVLAAFAAGADSYCMKDASTEKLLQAVIATHQGNSWIDPAIARIVLQSYQHLQPVQLPGSTVSINADDEYQQFLDAAPMTQRELEILQLIVAGCANATIADQLYISVGTVKTHVRNILNKLCVDDRTQAAVRALRSGLVT